MKIYFIIIYQFLDNDHELDKCTIDGIMECLESKSATKVNLQKSVSHFFFNFQMNSGHWLFD